MKKLCQSTSDEALGVEIYPVQEKRQPREPFREAAALGNKALLRYPLNTDSKFEFR